MHNVMQKKSSRENRFLLMIVYTAQKILLFLSVFAVAPHAGSVDRNFYPLCGQKARAVAPHAESVDRNTSRDYIKQAQWTSLSARRAWIEISTAL